MALFKKKIKTLGVENKAKETHLPSSPVRMDWDLLTGGELLSEEKSALQTLFGVFCHHRIKLIPADDTLTS